MGDSGAEALRPFGIAADLVEDQHAVAQFERFFDVVRDHEDGHVRPLAQFRQEVVHRQPRARV